MAKTSSKKQITSWKRKKNYDVVTPDNFERQVIGTTMASEPQQLAGRTVQVNMSDVTGDRSKQYVTLAFELDEVDGNQVKTKFKRYTIPSSYLRGKVRKGMSKVDYIGDPVIGGQKFRVKIIVLSHCHLSESQRKDVLAAIVNIIRQHNKDEVEQFVQFALFGKLGTEIYRVVKKIVPVTWAEVSHVELK
ncbi:30S ribosomal protein S3Ae [uncultured archaeon]|nr:30S ribosomal protein S3Ae [uncultured archaeon]